MATVFVTNGSLVVPKSGIVSFPDHLTDDFLNALFSAEPDDLGHLAKLYPRMLPGDRMCFEQLCMQNPVWAIPFATLALDWAAVGSLTGKWELSVMQPIYREPINSWLIKDLVATESGRWYAVDDAGVVYSSAELNFKYGQTMVEHLQRFLDFENIRIGRTIQAMESPFVEKEIQVLVGDGLQIVRRCGPANIPVRDWLLQPGEQFVGEAQ